MKFANSTVIICTLYQRYFAGRLLQYQLQTALLVIERKFFAPFFRYATKRTKAFLFMPEKIEKFEEMIEDPTAHQLKAYYDAKEKACVDAMKSTKSKNPHNKGSNLADFWDYVYDQFYEIQ